MADMCGDNRFEIIARAKTALLEGTNIDMCPDEMAVIDNILFRCWQMGWLDRYAEQTEPQTELVNDSPILVKDLVDDEFNPYDGECMRCKHLKLKCEFVPSYCKYEPRDEPRTEDLQDWKDRMWAEAVIEPQTDCGDFADRLAYERGVKHAWEVAQKVFNSTVTFYEAEDVANQIAKDEPQTSCKTCRYGEVDEGYVRCAYYSKADRKTENSSEKPNNCKTHAEGVWNAGFKTGYDKGYKDAQKVKDSQDLVKDLVKEFCEDGTWLERQGVYTLTLAEAKQRAADIIESVTQTETQNSNLTFEKRTMLDCYNCKRFETEDECIECHYEPKDEPQTETEVARAIIHKMIDNTDIAEDAYPDLRQRLHDAVDEYEPQTDCPWK